MKEFVTLIGFMCFCNGITQGEITPDNIFDPCEKGYICYFLNSDPLGRADNSIYLPTTPDYCDRTEFCMRLNIRPLPNDSCRHEFEIAAMNVKTSKEYIAIALSRDNQMSHDYGFYCVAGFAFLGIIEKRNTATGQFVTTARWKPQPSIMDITEFRIHKGTHFMRCGIITKRVHHARKNFFNLNIGVGALDKEDPWFLFMARGTKTSKGSNELVNEDKHKGYGQTNDALHRLETASKSQCATADTMHSNEYSLVIIITISFAMFHGMFS